MQKSEVSTIKNLSLFGGLAYLGVIITGVFSEGVVRGGLTDGQNAEITVKNIAENMTLWRWAAVSDIMTVTFDIIAAVCIYFLLKPVNKQVSLLAALIRIVAVTILAIGAVFHFLPVLLTNGQNYLQTFDTSQLATLALLSLKTHNLIYHISLILFAFNNVIIGVLMFKSEYFHKIIAFAAILFGVSYFANSFSWFVYPGFQSLIGGTALKISFFAELALSLWMIYKGISLKTVK
ncbi:DUF4386 domain-containing protein [Pseudaquidulcibacter saccharophilus]|uniref:DUF4386 domain-containing protein n=1 Tax=Pseudaquidulcibacter saccharophilus TaxID=2831900 RepID=UPI001EFF400A|nr:DUF4386 domain-containing protein [Pseudaquidulcibacter saccharophilus]